MTIVNIASNATGLSSNAFLVPGDEPALVDAGANFDAVDAIDLQFEGALEKIVLTHTHPDHVDNLQDLTRSFDIPVLGYDASSEYVDLEVGNGDTVMLGDHVYEAWFTPGHAPDHLCLFSDTASILFSGDLIFPNGGVGRTDLPGCDHDDLIESIRYVHEHTDQSLAAMYAGHGPVVESQPYRHIEAAADFVGIHEH